MSHRLGHSPCAHVQAQQSMDTVQSAVGAAVPVPPMLSQPQMQEMQSAAVETIKAKVMDTDADAQPKAGCFSCFFGTLFAFEACARVKLWHTSCVQNAASSCPG